MQHREFTHRLDAFALVHPWLWAIVGGLLAALALLGFHFGVATALVGAAIWYVVTGLSVRYGPGRQIIERRLARLRDDPSPGTVKAPPFGTKLWHKVAIGFVGLFLLWICIAIITALIRS